MMSAHQPARAFSDSIAAPRFGATAFAAFDAAYPNSPAVFDHAQADHPLLSLDALAILGEALPASNVEFNRADLPV
ncbi:MAG: transcriptional regulator, partial [Sphingopyxis sp.]